jgi:hypothetical protein
MANVLQEERWQPFTKAIATAMQVESIHKVLNTMKEQLLSVQQEVRHARLIISPAFVMQSPYCRWCPPDMWVVIFC